MIASESARPSQITSRFIHAVSTRLAENKRVRRSLPIWGRVHIDRQLPFLCVYRRPPRGNDAGTERLVTGEAAYVIASGVSKAQDGLTQLVRAIARTQGEQFGAFLILEIWSAEVNEKEVPDVSAGVRPGFQIVAARGDDAPGALLDTFREVLSRVTLRRRSAETEIRLVRRCSPRQMSPILPDDAARDLKCSLLGLEVRPVYRAPTGGELYPLVLRELCRSLSLALRQFFYQFARTQTTHRPKHYHMLGRRAMVKAVWEVDRRLAEVSDAFDFLLQVTPANAEEAWHRFEGRRFETAPVFQYRPLTADPVVLKRGLYSMPVERVEDPTLAILLRQKQDELDRQLTMLSDINTRRFVYGSLQLHGGVDDDLDRLAAQLLDRLPARARDDSVGGQVDAHAFARRAEEEIAYYRRQWPQVAAGVQVRGDIASGLMVSRGSLLIGKQTTIPASRVEALLQHEIGTHVLTYYNGRAQPFRQLYSGLAGYEALQEGLAVLAEYLVGGLSRPRMRLLAARVLAVRQMIDGATFVQVFRMLVNTHQFNRRTAFIIAMRIFRGGGLTKDAVYLRGLCHILDYLKKNGELSPLFVGKIAADHVPIIQELQWRKVLRDAPLTPRYMERSDARSRLEKLRAGLTVLDLVDRRIR